MKNLIIIIFLFLIENSYSQQRLEQTTFDYFIKNVSNIDYPKLGKVKFSGKAELATSGSLFGVECLDKEENLFVLENGFKPENSIIYLNNDSKQTLRKKPRKERTEKLSLTIYQTLKINEEYLVSLTVTEKGKGANYYFIYDRNLKLIKWCKNAFLI